MNSRHRGDTPLPAPAHYSRSALIGAGVLVLSLSGLGGSRAIAQSISPPQLLAQVPTQAPAINTLIFVNPSLGNDSNQGSQQSPFRTLTHALQVAPANSAIMLAPGIYAAESGEAFPITMRPGVSIQGDAGTQGEGVVLRGGGDFLSRSYGRQNVTVVGSNQAAIAGVTIMNTNDRGYGLWVESTSPMVMNNTFTNNIHDGVSINGTAEPLIQGNIFRENGANGITIYGSARPRIHNNLFERTGTGISIAQETAPTVTNNRIADNRNGIVVQANARPVLRNNTIEGNREAGLVAIAQSIPDLGTVNDPGNNIFRNNGEFDINARVNHQTVPAAGNQLTQDRVVGEVDLTGTTIPLPVAPTNAAPVTSLGTPVSMVPGSGRSLTPSSTPMAMSPSAIPTEFPRPTVSATATPIAVIPPTRPTNAALPTLSSATGRTTPSVPIAVRPATPATAIEIPVTPPAITSPRATAPAPGTAIDIAVIPPVAVGYGPTSGGQVATFSSSPASPAAIEIPVIPPQAQAVSVATTSVPSSPAVRAFSGAVNSNILPVPNGDIPVGNVGDRTRVSVAQGNWTSSSYSANRATALGLRYRVLVEATSDRTQEIVRSIIPGAFRTQIDGRTMMQAGAYSDRANAEETVDTLNRYGLQATIQPID